MARFSGELYPFVNSEDLDVGDEWDDLQGTVYRWDGERWTTPEGERQREELAALRRRVAELEIKARAVCDAARYSNEMAEWPPLLALRAVLDDRPTRNENDPIDVEPNRWVRAVPSEETPQPDAMEAILILRAWHLAEHDPTWETCEFHRCVHARAIERAMLVRP